MTDWSETVLRLQRELELYKKQRKLDREACDRCIERESQTAENYASVCRDAHADWQRLRKLQDRELRVQELLRLIDGLKDSTHGSIVAIAELIRQETL